MLHCADCGKYINYDNSWELEDGRIVCQDCCVEDTKRVVALIIDLTSEETL
jgi:hypothetical protein